MGTDYASFTPMLKALSDETRLQIMDMLSCEELCANEILEAFQFTQPTLSYHMKILHDAGLVRSVREGGWTRYSLIQENSEALIAFLSLITREKEECICNPIRRKPGRKKGC